MCLQFPGFLSTNPTKMGTSFQRTGQLKHIDFKATTGYYLQSMRLQCNNCNWEPGTGVTITDPESFYWISTNRKWHCCDMCCYPRHRREPAMHKDWVVTLTFDITVYPPPPKFACKYPYGRYFEWIDKILKLPMWPIMWLHNAWPESL